MGVIRRGVHFAARRSVRADPRARRSDLVNPILRFLQEHQEHMLEDLRAFVERETPSTDKALLDGFAEFLADHAASLGGRAEVVPVHVSGNHVRVRWGEENGQAPIFLLGHYDTVWPAGTLEVMPFEVESGVARGPGVFDMKCGLVQGFWAVRALREVAGVERPLVFLCNSDEEIGSPNSRTFIEEEALRAATVLVLEPSLNGALKTARKGVGRYTIHVTGRPSHAGLDPEGGISAIEEMARLILELHSHTDLETGTTVNAGVVSGGTRYNVIAAEALAEVDVRTVTRAEADRMAEVISKLKPRHPEAKVEVEGGMVWPPMERTGKIAELFGHARRLATEIGFELEEGLAGGASDGCLCADLGAPVLDGLGAVGGGAHATDEHVEVASIPLRAALVARLMETL
jgi:glutamate carboxypeptidase